MFISVEIRILPFNGAARRAAFLSYPVLVASFVGALTR